jgi:hypothetical protein
VTAATAHTVLRGGAPAPATAFLLAQVVATLITAAVAAAGGTLPATLAAFTPWAVVHGVVALRVAHALGAAPWWLPLNALFAPALLAGTALDLPPAWFLAAFVLLGGVYWSSFRSQVPLYLSSHHAGGHLVQLLPARPGARFVDLGCGFAGPLAVVAGARPDAACAGYEIAPLAWGIARLRASLCGGSFRVHRTSLWRVDLSDVDLAYAYLSPVPMPALWAKASTEMRAGTLLVSNSFAVPGVAPERVVELGDWQGTRLYVYRMPGCRGRA